VSCTSAATGVRVSKALHCGDDLILLLDYYEAAKLNLRANLWRLMATVDLVCTRVSGDMSNGVGWRERRLIAWTWECLMTTSDPQTGKIVEVAFTK
jgi:hypothetical protein